MGFVEEIYRNIIDGPFVDRYKRIMLSASAWLVGTPLGAVFLRSICHFEHTVLLQMLSCHRRRCCTHNKTYFQFISFLNCQQLLACGTMFVSELLLLYFVNCSAMPSCPYSFIDFALVSISHCDYIVVFLYRAHSLFLSFTLTRTHSHSLCQLTNLCPVQFRDRLKIK